MGGVIIDGAVSATVDVSHRLLQDDDIEKSTSIAVELGDRES